MIEFVTNDGEKILVNHKHILTIRPKRKDIFCNSSVMTFVNDKFLEVAHSYNEVLEKIREVE